MRKVIIIFCLAVLVSCKSESNKRIDASSMEIEVSETIETTDNSYVKSSFEDAELATQKLQELYDLMALKNQHPEFEESIQEQLNDYVSGATFESIIQDAVIKNVTLEEDIIFVSDSIQKLKLHFDLVGKTTVKKDSIWAIITTTQIKLNDKTLNSKKIRFAKN